MSTKPPTLDQHEHNHHDGHSHSHSDADGIIAAIKGGGELLCSSEIVCVLLNPYVPPSGDAGARVTLYGLLTNVGLTILKGCAGWYEVVIAS